MDKIRKDGRVNCSSEGLPEIEAVGPFDILSYTAAFIDGDGSFSMTKSGNSPSISAYNNNPQMLKNIQPVIGGGLHQNHRKEWQLRIGSIPGCMAACQKLIPKLITKKLQAETLLKACMVDKAQRTPINEELCRINRGMTYERPPDSASLKINTTKDASEWSYFGGYVDTDSNIEFQIQTHGLTSYYYPHFNIFCKNPAPLLWLQQRFGGQFLSRKRDGRWISSLEFEDQVHVMKILATLRPYVLDKQAAIDILLEACNLDAKNRSYAAKKLEEINERFHGLHKFQKTSDGKYVDGKRSDEKPHRTHKGVEFKDAAAVKIVHEVSRTDGDPVTIKYYDGSEETFSKRDMKEMDNRMYLHLESKELRTLWCENTGNSDDAISLKSGEKFSDIIEGWDEKTEKERDEIIWNDYCNELERIESKYKTDDKSEGSDNESGACVPA